MKTRKLFIFGRRVVAMLMALSVIGCSACNKDSTSNENNVEHQIWSTYSTRKVIQNPSDNSLYDQLPASLSIQMMQNETEGAQLIITAGSDIENYSLESCDLSDGKGHTISKNDIAVYAQKYVEIVRMHSTNKEIKAGNFVPDMLLPMEKSVEYKENKVKKGNNQGITVEITSKQDTVAGVYTGTFVLDIDGVKHNIPVSCEVWDFGFEGRRTFMTSFLLYRHQLLYGEYDDSDELVDRYIDFFMKYKANIYVIKDNYTVEEFKREAVRQIVDNNCSSIIIPVNFDLSYTSTGNQAKTVKDFIKALVEISTEDLCYVDYAYFYPSNVDEADMETGAAGGSKAKMAAAYRLMAENGEIIKTLQDAVSECESEGLFDGFSTDYVEHIKKKIVEIPQVFTNVGFVSDAVDNLISTFCPYLSLFDEEIMAEKYLEQAQEKANGNLWAYTCTGPLFPYPSFHTDDYSLGARVTGWMEKKYGINGFLYWSCVRNTDSSNVYIDVYNTAARYSYCSGEGYLVYPGKYYGSNEPFPTNRLISHRESMDDYDMLCVYEQLLNRYAEKYDIEGGLKLNDYVNDIYDSIFDGATYYTDDSLVFKAREELARRILALKNDDNLIVSSTFDGGETKVTIYSTSNSIKVNDTTINGVVSGEGYKYETGFAGDTKILTIKSNNQTYSYKANGVEAITDFANSGVDTAVCSGRTGVESTKSSIIVNQEDKSKADVKIRSYYAKGEGYGASKDVNGIDGATQRLYLWVSFPVANFDKANSVNFTITNTGTVKIEMYVQLVMSNGTTEEIGSAYCNAGKTNNIRIHINEELGIDLSKVTAVRLAFKNVYYDANNLPELWADRTFTLSDLWYDKK